MESTLKATCYDCETEFDALIGSDVDAAFSSVGQPIIEVLCINCGKLNVVTLNQLTGEVTTSGKV